MEKNLPILRNIFVHLLLFSLYTPALQLIVVFSRNKLLWLYYSILIKMKGASRQKSKNSSDQWILFNWSDIFPNKRQQTSNSGPSASLFAACERIITTKCFQQCCYFLGSRASATILVNGWNQSNH